MFAGAFLTGGPVGHNKPLIFPLIAQRFGAQIIACKCVHTIDKIVGRHYCPGLGLPNCDFKSPEVDFPKSALRHILGNGLPLVFLIVTAEVLDGNTQTGMTLDASRNGCCHNAGHILIKKMAGKHPGTEQWKSAFAASAFSAGRTQKP